MWTKAQEVPFGDARTRQPFGINGPGLLISGNVAIPWKPSDEELTELALGWATLE